MKKSKEISPWWIPIGVFLSFVSYRYDLFFILLSPQVMYLFGLCAVLIVIFSNHWLIGLKDQDEFKCWRIKLIVEKISFSSMVLILLCLGWLSGEVLINYIFKGLK